MRVLVTAGPTREYIDRVRFITNASSGQMGYACAAAAVKAGHQVTLLTGPVALKPPKGCTVVPFVSVADLKAQLGKWFARCDGLVMSAAVGDFTVRPRRKGKLSRRLGPVRITLVPTEDVLAGVARGRRADQVLIAFAVEEGENQRRARRKLGAKNCDYVVLNPPAAMGAQASRACVLTRRGLALPWARRKKADLARRIVALLKPR